MRSAGTRQRRLRPIHGRNIPSGPPQGHRVRTRHHPRAAEEAFHGGRKGDGAETHSAEGSWQGASCIRRRGFAAHAQQPRVRGGVLRVGRPHAHPRRGRDGLRPIPRGHTARGSVRPCESERVAHHRTGPERGGEAGSVQHETMRGTDTCSSQEKDRVLPGRSRDGECG